CDDYRAKRCDIAHIRAALSRAGRRGRRHPRALSRQRGRRGKRSICGQWQPNADCNGGSRRRAKPSRAASLAGVVLLVLLFLTGPLQYLPRCVLAAIVFTIAVGMVDVARLRDIRRESPGEFYLAVTTAATVVTLGVEQGILLAIALSLFRHVRHSYRPHTMMLAPDAAGMWIAAPAAPGIETEPGLIVYRFGA